MSLARRHRDRILAAQTVASAPNRGAGQPPAAGTPTPAAGAQNPPAERAAAQVALRFTHDLRRLKEIKAVSGKIAAKAVMLPEYQSWVEGTVAADAGVGAGTTAEIVPTYMVWLIDTAAYGEALDLVPFLLRHKVAMPARYNRDVATVVLEEIADAALKQQNAGEAFELAVLERVATLTDDIDLHDEPRAKLYKAIGIEHMRQGEEAEAGPAARTALLAAANAFRKAHGHDSRIGVQGRIKRAEKLIAVIDAAAAAAEKAAEQGGGETPTDAEQTETKAEGEAPADTDQGGTAA
ncbi:Phage small terminase subunit [Sphingomonas laterariae]|uniref:Phage small terminase subunit n=1 Tax=Edaphosphingomonas laterariae TaxID=861865 RepID=A0A239CKB5_9SPHN|nr:phage terminase small subunit [Sphingomonas laterariae]SNS20111.1 Phage small terminase subunit [Sphingomonas laterariae]